MEKTVSIQEWLKAAESVKLTKPQATIVDLVRRGYRLKEINKHYRNGGQIIWVTPSGNDMGAGHIYRALQYLHYKLRPIIGYEGMVDGLWII